MTQAMSFSHAFITTILWTENGFTPNPTIYDVGEQLVESLKQKDATNMLYDLLKLTHENINADIDYVFDGTTGNERLALGDFKEIPLSTTSIESLRLRIYVCNGMQGKKCKITVSSRLPLDLEWGHIEISRILAEVYNKNEQVCKFLQALISKEFSLGDIEYISHISSIESSDEDVDDIISSEYNHNINKFITSCSIANTDESKILQTYYILLSNDPSNFKESPYERNSIVNNLIDYNANESRMNIFYENQKIPAKTLNFSIPENKYSDNVPRRIIASLTKPHCGKVMTNALVGDYLSRT